ncbi:class I SAM-dependent methyltransferase [Kribbella sp. VKM Ac-2569]|uniref:class I SAM-dependent methyltransferase n=1 Tax=Kribbella sp. VKM Ac-2569 TaxID=2512220 RepID=UPI001300B4BD|nr:class I SAM-dependent methyltransferase [Kribbella sp. VKM Ac-2569]
MNYIFDTGSELGRHHLDHLGNLIDAPTHWCLERRGLSPTARCLEIGAGSGRIANWLAARTGEVVAVDIDTAQLTDLAANVEVRKHDVRDGLGVDGPFDLIHARLVLMHIPEREQIFAELVNALAPGGLLVIGDFTGRRLHPISAPSAEDRALWARMQYLSHEVVGPAGGISLTWAGGTAARMTAAGLTDVHTMEYSETTAGGTDGCLLHRNLNEQAEPLLLAAGATPDELARYRELMTDPSFTAWFYQFLCTSGVRPR